MQHYSTREAARILEATEAQVRSWAELGHIVPHRGPGRRLEFGFQELLLLKTTKGLLASGVPSRRVRRIWSSLRRQLDSGIPLSGVSIHADGRRAVAWDGSAQWQPDSGQFLLNFDAGEIAERAGAEPLPVPIAADLPELVVRSMGGGDHGASGALGGRASLTVLVSPGAVTSAPAGPTPRPALTAEQWFTLACELEHTSALEARQAYHEALEIDPCFADAHVNLGRHYHEAGELGKAEAHYRDAVRWAPEDAVAHFNLGVLLEDRGRPEDAVHAYRQAIARDPDMADAHYNLGLLLESLNRRSAAMSHFITADRLYASE